MKDADRLIIALDVPGVDEARRAVAQIEPHAEQSGHRLRQTARRGDNEPRRRHQSTQIAAATLPSSISA